ncbi:ABC transporter permease [Salinarimonas sp. NSM]|uniref:ABC transporter permease n=1 Tax=Salinarimonas sp. NSM TaxID=3458003 RepID=UPI004036B95B
MLERAQAVLPSRLRAPPSWRLRAPSGETILLAGVALYLGVFTLWPLGRLLLEAVGPNDAGETLGILRDQWQSRSTSRALWNTLEAGTLATLVSVVLGATMAFVVALTDVRAKTALTFALLLPLLVPSQITALAWIELIGPSSPILRPLGLASPPGTTNPLYSLGGIVLVMGVEHAALVFLAVRAGLRAMPRDLVEAARIAGARPLVATLRVVLPLSLPALLAGAALAFVSAIGNFGVPALLGIPGRYTMLTTLIYQRLNGFGPSVLGEVAAIALILILIAMGGLALRAIVAARMHARVERASAMLRPFPLGRARLPLETGVWVVLGLVSFLPLCALLAASLTPAVGVRLSLETLTLDHYRFAVLGQEMTRRAFANSFLLAGATALVAGLVAVPLAYLAVMRRMRAARVLDLVADTPYAIPGTVLALGAILVFLPPLPILGVSVYNSLWIILFAYFARFMTLALRPVTASLETIEPALDEAARIAGARAFRRLFVIVVPIAAPAAVAGGLLIFMTAFNELTVSALLWSSGTETLGVVVFFLQYEGNSPAAAALATATVVVTLLLALLLDVVGRRLPGDVVPWRDATG